MPAYITWLRTMYIISAHMLTLDACAVGRSVNLSTERAQHLRVPLSPTESLLEEAHDGAPDALAEGVQQVYEVKVSSSGQ